MSHNKIHYLTPYSPEGNIGRAYNEACANVPSEEDWIVIRDGDTMFLTPEWGRQVKDVLEANGDRYGLYGAMTNRVASPRQRIEGTFDEMDLKKHYLIAEEEERNHWSGVEDMEEDVAGFFMAFRKSTWTKVGGFKENTPVFDRKFTRAVRKAGLGVGLMRGLYVLHAYRLWSRRPAFSTGHLDTQRFSK